MPGTLASILPRPRSFILIAALFLFLLLPAQSRAATPEQVDAAIENAKAYLYTQQKNDTWETRSTAPADADKKKSGYAYRIDGGQYGGVTALATYALIAGGDSPQDPRLIPAIKFLLHTEIKGVYALGMKCQLYTFLPPTPELRARARADADELQDAVQESGMAKGFYDYLVNTRNTKRVDHSVSQYGVLGMWACQHVEGIEVPKSYWATVEKAWIDDQDPESGGWSYQEKPSSKYPVTASMTAAGVATLFITQDYLHPDAGVACKGNIVNENIDHGLKWLSDNFSEVFSTTGVHAPWYSLYGIERIGVASGLKYFGSVNWYDAGADYLVKNQSKSGAWGGNVSDTCFGILFLSRGRAPVVFNKLQYDINGKPGNWNQRPRDVANAVHYIAHQTERDLNWQIMSLKAPMHELHDAPIIYMAGNESLQFAPEEEARLKQFCEEGGIILANADCATDAFAASFRKLGARLFPSYEFRELPADHPIFTSEQYLRTGWKDPPTVLSLSNGIREMMLLLPSTDAGREWQKDNTIERQADFQFADNLFLYAVDKQNLLEKGKTYLIHPDEKIEQRHRIKLGRLQYDGNWDPEPAGWPRLAAIFHNMGVRLETFPIKLGENKLGNGHGVGVHVAHLTGTSRLKLNAAARDEIKKFVEGGGTLIIDAAGGSGEFADSIEADLAVIFGSEPAEKLKEPLAPDDPLFNIPGGKIEDFVYRPYARRILGNTLRGPQIKAISLNDRAAVYYSREDLSAGLVGMPMDGIVGCTPATATDIMRNLILYSALGPKAAAGDALLASSATQPSTASSTPGTSTTQPVKAPKPKKPPKPRKPPTTKKAAPAA